jgi:D-lactate dehydrogenase
MNICFVSVEKQETLYFKEHLKEHSLSFVQAVDDVPADAEIVSVFVHSHIDGAFLDAHPALNLIANRSTNTDHIDLDACKRSDVEVASVPSYGDTTVAEHTFMLILCIARRITEALAVKKQRAFSYENLRGTDLAGKTLGIIGCGRIGTQVARLARAFRMEVLAWDVSQVPAKAREIGFAYTDLDHLLLESDVLTLHVPLTTETHHLINAERLARCKKGVLIVNTGRGGLIDTQALVENLDSGHVAGVGLDVVEDERVLQRDMPHILSGLIVSRLQKGSRSDNHERVDEIKKLMTSHDLVSHHNVVATPHTAFNTFETVARINQITLENILAHVKKLAAPTRRPAGRRPASKKAQI